MEQQDRIRLNIIGITFNQIESGVYAVILQEAEGTRRVPIIIGAAEAQAIECKLQDIKVPRPLTHDLMNSVLHKFDIKLQYVWIHKLPNGVFAADLHFINESTGTEQTIDSRSSDAIALAVRTGAPIYTSEELVREVGFQRQAKREENANNPTPYPNVTVAPAKDLTTMTIEELQNAMSEASDKEDYEKAARIKSELDRRKTE